MTLLRLAVAYIGAGTGAQPFLCVSGMIYVTADKVNGVPCAWGIVGKDSKPMKEPPHPQLARG